MPFSICAVPMMLTLIYAVHKYGVKKIFIPCHSVWFYLFCVFGIVVGLIYWHWVGVLIFLQIILLFLFTFYEQSIMTDKLRVKVLQVVSAGSIIAALAAFIQKIPIPTYRSISFFFNANYYAFICEIIVITLIYALYKYGKNLLYIIAIAANLGGIFASGCRTAWLTIFFGVLVVMLCFKKYRHVLMFLGLALLICLGIYFLPNLFFPRYVKFGSDKSLRFLIWRTALGFIKTHLIFGQGAYTYFTLSTGRAHDAHAHNLILDMLVNFGIVGSSLILTFIVLTIKDLIRGIKSNSACICTLGVLTAMFVHGFTDVPFVAIQTGAMSVILIALSGVIKNKAFN